MELGSLLVLLPVLACPLMMIWMMRGGHRGHGHALHGGHHDTMHARPEDAPAGDSLAELRARRAELDAEIARHESDEVETTSPAAG